MYAVRVSCTHNDSYTRVTFTSDCVWVILWYRINDIHLANIGNYRGIITHRLHNWVKNINIIQPFRICKTTIL